MKTWLKQQLAALDDVPDDAPGTISNPSLRKPSDGPPSPGCPQSYQRVNSAGPVGVELARRVLSACLEQIETDGLLSIQQAADYLGYSVRGLRNLIKQGRIRFTRNGGGPYRFRQEWLAEFTAPPAARQPLRNVAHQHHGTAFPLGGLSHNGSS